MKKRTMIYMKEVAKVMPFVLLVADCFSLFFYRFDWYNDQFYYLFTQFIGHGIILLIGYAFFAHYHRLCLYTLISIYGLLLLNILNIIYYIVGGFNNYSLYVSIILIVSLCLSIIFLIKKR
jgi:hypothetical protein